nr:hypothetical protein [Tanacetum cinerariifolium]
PDYDDYRACDIESDIREIEFLLFQSEHSDFKDSINQSVLTHYDDLFVDPTPEMFADEQPPDYSFPPRFDTDIGLVKLLEFYAAASSCRRRKAICFLVVTDPRINTRKYTIENSFTLGSTEEADVKKSPYYKVVCAFDSDKVTILQSCNGLLLCTGSRRHAFDYVYNPSTNLLKILSEPDYANVDSNVYGCAGLRERQLKPVQCAI